MTFRTDSLRLAVAAVCAREGTDITGLPGPALLELSGHVARLRRDADVLMAVVSAEIRRRSEAAEPGAGLATRHGFRSAGELVAQTTGGSLAEAKRLMTTGGLLADAESLTDPEAAAEGSPVPEPTPMARFRSDLAEAVREGRIGVDAAALFTSAVAALMKGPPPFDGTRPSDGMLPSDRAARSDTETSLDSERTRALFSKALTKASGLPLHRIRALVWQAQAFADPGAWAEREERQHEARSLTVRDDADGMVTLTARLTPLAASPVRAVLDAGVRSAMQARRDNPDSDPRTAWQMRADILTDLCRHALDCTQATSGVKTTVVVRMTRADLESGLGLGEIDGTAQPVTAGALRSAAADAEIVPAVLGGPSEVLDWGRSRRLFTPAQRLALVERDGGCAWCHAPPSWCEAHHIRWWERDAGPTDLANAVLICARCHHRIHRDGWDIETRNNVVHFIPPRSVDPTRTPRIGGRQRYDLAA